MSAGVTTTHDKYDPFTRAELQQLRDRAQWVGSQLIDQNAAHSHLDLARAADHLDAILARASAKPDLKLYDPNADTELYEPPAVGGFAAFDAAVPAPAGAEPPPGWAFTEVGPPVAARSFTSGPIAAPDAAPPHPEGGIDTGRRLGVLRALHRYHDLILSVNGIPNGIKAAAARLIHSELATLAVKMSPNPVDDVVLELLRALVPKPA